MRKSMIRYGICIVGMVLLVIASLYLPQVVFTIQDRYQMANTKVEKRTNLTNISQINTTYENRMYDRMSKLAAMNLKEAIVTAVDYDSKEETKKVIESVCSQEWMMILNDVTLYAFNTLFEKMSSDNIRDCKKYIVYGNDYQEGVALMMWYFDIYMADCNTRMRLLVDSETESIYYIKITAGKSLSEQKYDTVAESYGGYKIDGTEMLYASIEQLRYHLLFYTTYYESTAEELDGTDENNWSDKVWYKKVKFSEKQWTFTTALPYGELSMDFLFEIECENEIDKEVSMGIPIIGNLIPEMIQD